MTVNVTEYGEDRPRPQDFGYVDFNGDGDFDTEEQLFVDQLVTVHGANVLTFDVPENAVSEQI